MDLQKEFDAAFTAITWCREKVPEESVIEAKRVYVLLRERLPNMGKPRVAARGDAVALHFEKNERLRFAVEYSRDDGWVLSVRSKDLTDDHNGEGLAWMVKTIAAAITPVKSEQSIA